MIWSQGWYLYTAAWHRPACTLPRAQSGWSAESQRAHGRWTSRFGVASTEAEGRAAARAAPLVSVAAPPFCAAWSCALLAAKAERGMSFTASGCLARNLGCVSTSMQALLKQAKNDQAATTRHGGRKGLRAGQGCLGSGFAAHEQPQHPHSRRTWFDGLTVFLVRLYNTVMQPRSQAQSTCVASGDEGEQRTAWRRAPGRHCTGGSWASGRRAAPGSRR